MSEIANKTKQHFCIGLAVDVNNGAKPAGWGDDPFTEDVPKNRQIEEVYGSQPGFPWGTYNVGGWAWAPHDVRYR